jgi:hypothetical protein
MARFLPLILAASLFLTPLASAETKETNPKGTAASSPPIEMKMNTGLFGILGSSVDYSLEGRKLERYEDFKALIYPLQDEEASRLIRDSQSHDLIARLFYGGGVAVGVDVALSFKPVPVLNDDFFDRVATGFFTAQILWGAGLIFQANAESDKFNAIQRYNHQARGEKPEAWRITPGFSMGEDQMGLNFSYVF